METLGKSKDSGLALACAGVAWRPWRWLSGPQTLPVQHPSPLALLPWPSIAACVAPLRSRLRLFRLAPQASYYLPRADVPSGALM